MDHTNDSDRWLWAAVLQQAVDDVFELPMGCTEYEAAAGFLSGTTNYWRSAREEVAAHLEVSGDAILLAGKRCVLARRRKEGLPDIAVPSPRPAPAKVEPPPVLAPPEIQDELRLRRQRFERWKGRNPFSPFRQAS